MTRQVRDLDDNGTVFWVPTSKTEVGVRRVEVPEVLRPHLLRMVEGRAPTEPLFPGLAEQVATSKQEAAIDTLLKSKNRSKNQSKSFGPGPQMQQSPTFLPG